MIRKVSSAAMAIALAAGMTLSVVPEAQAYHGHGGGVGLGIAAGIIGLGILGAAAHADGYYGPRYYSRYDGGCYPGPRVCHWTQRHCFENDYGDTVCRGGRYLCERPLVCD